MPDTPNNGSYRESRTPKMTGTAQDSAALLLVESLINGLIARSILSVQDAIDIIDIAADVEGQLDDAALAPLIGEFESLLEPMARSLRGDLTA